MGNKRLEYLVHVLIWLILLGIPLVFPELPEELESRMHLKYFSHLLALVLAFYVNYSVLIPLLLFRNKTWQYGLSLVALVMVINLIGLWITEELALEAIFQSTIGGFVHGVKVKGMGFTLITTLITLMIGTSLKLIQRFLDAEKLQNQVQEEQLNIELAMLKNQISPHFFFNTLNTIYSLTETDVQTARTSILKLSKLMRYLLYETQKLETSLAKEVGFLEDYIDLMKARLPENVKIDFSSEVSQGDMILPPLLFIPLVENAFKHGVSYQSLCEIKFDLVQQNGRIHFASQNPSHPREEKDNAQGLGLSNLRRRLDLLYPGGQYGLVVQESDGLFVVKMTLPTYEA